MNTDHLKYFFVMCEEPTIAKAAERLYISPQGLGKAIRQLEQSLGVDLFEGEGDTRRLTEYGEALRVHASRILAEQAALFARFDEIGRRADETVRVAFSYGVLGSLGVAFIEDFSFSHRGVSVRYTQVPDLECERMLLAREVDVGFTIGPFDDQLETVELCREGSVLWVDEGEPVAGKRPATIEDLHGAHLAMIGEGFKMHDTLPRLCREAGFELDVAFSTPEMGVIKQLAGKSGVYGLTVAHEDADLPPNVRAVPLEGADWYYGVSFVKGRRLSEAQREFVDFAVRYTR